MVILALPDRVLGPTTAEIVSQVNSGAMLVCLDPAAAYAGVLAERDDVSYFIAHPCHPPLFGRETDPEAQEDWFGGNADGNLPVHHPRGDG